MDTNKNHKMIHFSIIRVYSCPFVVYFMILFSKKRDKNLRFLYFTCAK